MPFGRTTFTRPVMRFPGSPTMLVGAALWVACLTLPLAAQQRSDESSTGSWEVLEGCKLMDGAAMDGDSFHVLHADREFIFRLYFVDAPETDKRLTQRIEDQAAYFDVASEQIPTAGRIAEEFTRQKLRKSAFTVITRWQNAMGRSKLARFYGVVLVQGDNLAEQLVENGLARIYGYRANWPGGPRSATFINQLKNLELGAREKKLGLWNQKQFAKAAGSPASIQLASITSPTPQTEDRSRIDLNSASDPELQKLPGIGKVLAQRIVAHRPFKSVEELDDVVGIGQKTMAKLRPLVRVDERDQ